MDVSEKISNAIDGIKGQIGDPDKLRVKFSKPRVPVYIRADKIRIYQVIANLINNAIKFTKEGTISIKVENKDKIQVAIAVKDTGTGINSEILPRLFTEFSTSFE